MNKITPKGWGYEHTLVNNEKYCGKLLFFVKGHSCSFHYHLVKDETFYVSSGKITVKYTDIIPKEGEFIFDRAITLEAGDTFHVPPGRVHQMTALEDTSLFEFSTTDYPEDSYKIVRGD